MDAALKIVRSLPRFAVRGDDIRILSSPSDFFSSLNANIASSRRRISLGSLYLGVGQRERELVQALDAACAANDRMRVQVLLDHSRGQRPNRAQGGASSLSVLAPLVCRHGHRRVGVSLLQMPQLAGWKQHLPSPFDETVAVMHLKVYAFDDTLLLSGANLSSDYFERRQDRYVEVKRAPALAAHYHGLIERLAHCDRAYQLQRRDSHEQEQEEGSSTQLHAPPADGTCIGFEAALARFFIPPAVPQGVSEVDSVESCMPDQSFDTMLVPTLQFGQGRFDGATSDTDLVHALLAGCAHHAPDAETSSDVRGGAADAANGTIDNTCMSAGTCAGEIRLASGYFNLLPSVQRVVARSRADVCVVTASPQANGFFGAAGIKGALPQAYVELEKDFLHKCACERTGQFGAGDGDPAAQSSTCGAGTDEGGGAAASQGQQDARGTVTSDALGHVRVYEYTRPDWTFHAKGLWLRVGDELLTELLQSRAPTSQDGDAPTSSIAAVSSIDATDVTTPGHSGMCAGQQAATHDMPNATLVGSSNFGARSAQRDLESQVFLCTDNVALRKRLLEEWVALCHSVAEDMDGTPAVAGGRRDGAAIAVTELVDTDVMARPERQLQGWGWQRGHWIKPVTKIIRTFM